MNFFYFISPEKFTICDLEYSKAGKDIFDIRLFDLANDKKLLNALNLAYINNGFGQHFTHQERGEWFAGYLAAFVNDSAKPEAMHQKAKTDPMVRIIIQDSSIFEGINLRTSNLL